MAKDIKLNTNHDILFENNDIVLLTEDEEIAQSIEIRLLFIKNEWTLDFLMGTQWFDVLFSTQFSDEFKKQYLKDIIIQTDGVIGIDNMSFVVDSATKKANITFTAKTIYGEAAGTASI